MLKKFRVYTFLIEAVSTKTITMILGVDPRERPLMIQLNEETIVDYLLKTQGVIKDICRLCTDESVTGMFNVST